MEGKIKLVIFDWGGTLHDPVAKELFPGTREILDKLSKKYTLVLVSLAVSQSREDRLKTIEGSGVTRYFAKVLVDEEDKDKLYEEVLGDFKMDPANVAVVDDRVIRGIAWGNKRGATTIWLKRGRFAGELPDEKTGQPTYTIQSLKELLGGGML